MVLSWPDAHLIFINDLSLLTVCLDLLICEFVSTRVCIASCNMSAHIRLLCAK